jgi:hypothetical protein
MNVIRIIKLMENGSEKASVIVDRIEAACSLYNLHCNKAGRGGGG